MISPPAALPLMADDAKLLTVGGKNNPVPVVESDALGRKGGG